MKVKTVICLTILTTLTIACQTSKRLSIDNFHKNERPPNGIKISDQLFCDQTEMTNIGWKEYLFWTRKIFGSHSEEYHSALPDTSVWLDSDSCLYSFADQYLRDPKYQNHPVVGITQKQAIDYSTWRSDRVFEALLIKYKIIKYDTAQTIENHFTIERFFSGQLSNVISEKKVKYYPQFRLPSISERQLLVAYSDSLNKVHLEKCKSKQCRECMRQFPEMWSNTSPCFKDSNNTDPTRSVLIACLPEKGELIYNLWGNVSEWTSETNIVAGGAWLDKREQILNKATSKVKDTNAGAGFRNVFEWKIWIE
jgi:hypothetical protein